MVKDSPDLRSFQPSWDIMLLMTERRRKTREKSRSARAGSEERERDVLDEVRSQTRG